MKINLRDLGFAHQTISPYATLYGTSNIMEWDRTCSQPGPTVCTDAFLRDDIVQFDGDKIAWLMEPEAIDSRTYSWIRTGYKHFVEIWSHNDDVLRFAESVGVPHVFVPGSGCWVDQPDQKIHYKTLLCSFIASSKNWAPGHQLRQEVRRTLPPFVDSFGRGFIAVEHKAEALVHYAFSIAIENSRQDTYFTEKLIDCFSTGTIPIYWGTHKISEFFDMRGVIQFETLENLEEILTALTMYDYDVRADAVRRNFETAKRFFVPEDYGVRGSAVIK